MQFDGVDNRTFLDDGTVAYEDTSGRLRVRFGFSALEGLAKKLCALVTRSEALIRRVFNDSPAVIIMLDLALIVCGVVQQVARAAQDGAVTEVAPVAFQGVSTRLRSLADRIDSDIVGGA